MRFISLAAALVVAGGAQAQDVDTDQLLNDLRILSADNMEGRAPGTDGSAKARAYLLARFVDVGLSPVGENYEHDFTFTTRRDPDTERAGVNIVGRIAGESSDRVIVVTAHYDHVGVRDGDIYNGADDNASGVSALLAIAEAFAEVAPRHDIVFVALDAEESGLQGARAFVADPPVPVEAIALNVNFDMVSRSDVGELYVAGAHHTPALRAALAPVGEASPVSLLFGHDAGGGEDDWTTQSDHAAFHAAGVPFVYFGVEDHPDYHQPTDDFEAVPQEFFTAVATLLVDAVRALDADLEAVAPAS